MELFNSVARGKSLCWKEIANIPSKIDKPPRLILKIKKKRCPSPNHPFKQSWSKRRVKTEVTPIT
jgi:hypothetical protein